MKVVVFFARRTNKKAITLLALVCNVIASMGIQKGISLCAHRY